jgi:hypothetical protein
MTEGDPSPGLLARDDRFDLRSSAVIEELAPPCGT